MICSLAKRKVYKSQKALQNVSPPHFEGVEREASEVTREQVKKEDIVVLQMLGDHVLTSPALTGDWEARLARIERGEEARDAFMRDIEAFTRDVVTWFADKDRAVMRAARTVIGPCPRCDGEIVERPMSYSCTSWQSKEEPGCGYTIWKRQGGRTLTMDEIKEMVANGISSADIRTERVVIGPCPTEGCGGDIVERSKSFGCTSWKSRTETGCGFVIWKRAGGKEVVISTMALVTSKAEMRAVEHVVDGSRSLQTMLGEGYIGRMTLLRLVLLLDLYSVLQWAAPTHAAVEDPVAAMARTLTAMERGNHFVALGVHWSAGPEEIHGAWERLHAEYAPDGRWAPHDPATAAAIVRRCDAAWQVLRDDGARVQHRHESYEGMDEGLLAPLVEARAKALEMRGERRAAAEMSRLQKEFAAVLPRRERK